MGYHDRHLILMSATSQAPDQGLGDDATDQIHPLLEVQTARTLPGSERRHLFNLLRTPGTLQDRLPGALDPALSPFDSTIEDFLRVELKRDWETPDL